MCILIERFQGPKKGAKFGCLQHSNGEKFQEWNVKISFQEANASKNMTSNFEFHDNARFGKTP